MDSYQFINLSKQVRDCSSSTNNTRNHGFSKSQRCLQKILQIIASYPPHQRSKQSSSKHQIQEFDESRVLGIDLNIELCQESDGRQESAKSLSNYSLVVNDDDNNNKVISNSSVEKSSSMAECDPINIQEIEKESEVEIQEEEVVKKEEEENFLDSDDGRVKTALSIQEKQQKKKSDCFTLLVEAAEMVSGDFNDKELETNNNDTSKARKSEAVKEEAPPPVTRSKRGRSHVLPSRYRDSVLLEPWKRQPRRGRVAAATPPATIVSRKRGKLN